MKLPSYDLAIGDVIRTSDISEGYTCATVYNVTDKDVYVVRPYVHVSDFVSTGGVITYLGEEKFTIPRSLSYQYEVIERRDPEEYRKRQRETVNKAKEAIESGKPGVALNLLRSL